MYNLCHIFKKSNIQQVDNSKIQYQYSSFRVKVNFVISVTIEGDQVEQENGLGKQAT